VRILIAGAGALGSVFGGFLKLAGYEVTLLGRLWHLEAIKKSGLMIEGIWGRYTISDLLLAVSPADLKGIYDLVFVTVKANDTSSIAGMLTDFIHTSSLVVSLQNGLGNVETLASRLETNNLAAGRVIFGAEITCPGAVRVTVIADDVVIGPPFASIPESRRAQIAKAAGLLASAGIPCRYDDNVQGLIWAKAFYNCALNPLGALFGLNYGQLADNPYARRVMEEIIREAFAVALSHNVTLPWVNSQEYLKTFYQDLLPPTRNHRPSMLQDIERGRSTEIDALNGRIADWARESGLSAPVNETITGLIKIREILTFQSCG
jgi:2-dehydropantoate 2-reductase